MSEKHELNIVDEHWMSENSLMLTIQCSKCKEEFQGLLIKK